MRVVNNRPDTRVDTSTINSLIAVVPNVAPSSVAPGLVSRSGSRLHGKLVASLEVYSGKNPAGELLTDRRAKSRPKAERNSMTALSGRLT